MGNSTGSQEKIGLSKDGKGKGKKKDDEVAVSAPKVLAFKNGKEVLKKDALALQPYLKPVDKKVVKEEWEQWEHTRQYNFWQSVQDATDVYWKPDRKLIVDVLGGHRIWDKINCTTLSFMIATGILKATSDEIELALSVEEEASRKDQDKLPKLQQRVEAAYIDWWEACDQQFKKVAEKDYGDLKNGRTAVALYMEWRKLDFDAEEEDYYDFHACGLTTNGYWWSKWGALIGSGTTRDPISWGSRLNEGAFAEDIGEYKFLGVWEPTKRESIIQTLSGYDSDSDLFGGGYQETDFFGDEEEDEEELYRGVPRSHPVAREHFRLLRRNRRLKRKLRQTGRLIHRASAAYED